MEPILEQPDEKPTTSLFSQTGSLDARPDLGYGKVDDAISGSATSDLRQESAIAAAALEDGSLYARARIGPPAIASLHRPHVESPQCVICGFVWIARVALSTASRTG
jgi:hypothetical protein